MATLVVTGYVEVWHVLVFAFLAGSGQAFEQPSRQALIPQLIPRTEMANAVAMSSIIWQGSRLMGPAVAGGIIALYGVGITLYMAAAGFTLVLCVSPFHPPQQSRQSPPIARHAERPARWAVIHAQQRNRLYAHRHDLIQQLVRHVVHYSYAGFRPRPVECGIARLRYSAVVGWLGSPHWDNAGSSTVLRQT